jgi:hypothetical protein
MPFPVAVDGRILSAELAGDISDWVEIAQNGDYSLIVRKNFINIYPNAVMYGTVVRNDPIWQSTNGYAAGGSNDYRISVVRKYINEWFNGAAPRDADKLPMSSRMREFTMQNSAIHVLGTSTTHQSVVNGFSNPERWQVGIGNDIAFALSYGECASFLSNIHYLRNNMVGNTYVSNQPSTLIAQANYAKINISNKGTKHGMWLRSPGDIKTTAGHLGPNFSSVAGRVFQYTSTAHNDNLVYPAVWVHKGIFNEQTEREVTVIHYIQEALLSPNYSEYQRESFMAMDGDELWSRDYEARIFGYVFGYAIPQRFITVSQTENIIRIYYNVNPNT